jgi:hypothetical protein
MCDPEKHPSENLITVPVGIDLEHAKKMLHKHKIEKLLVIVCLVNFGKVLFHWPPDAPPGFPPLPDRDPLRNDP